MTSESLEHLRIGKPPFKVSGPMLDQVIDLAKGYVKDAKHYAERRKSVTSLACVAYAEGLLDALKYLELVDF
jgi:FAD synthetase